jgi:hypothetical protein
LSSLLSLSLSPLPFLSSPLSPPPWPLPPLPQLPSPPPPEHSRFRCCPSAHLSPARGLPRHCRRRCCCCARLSPARGLPRRSVVTVTRARCQGVALRRERVRKCSGKDHRCSQAKEPVV